MENIPLLMDHLEPVYDAFRVLNASRPIGMEPSSIPVSEIFAYLDGVGVLKEDLRDLYVAGIQAMDRVMLKREEPAGGSSS